MTYTFKLLLSMNRFYQLAFLLICMLGQLTALCQQNAHQRSVEVSAEVSVNPPYLFFSWPADATATDYAVYRKGINDTSWGNPIAMLPGFATSYTDTDIAVGEAFEYAFFKKEFEPVTWDVCVTPGTEVKLKVNDMYGIGLCCSFGFGYYEAEACNNVVAYGDDFVSEESTIFTVCDEGTACTNITITIEQDLFPNSTSWELTNNQTGQFLANSGGVGVHIADRPSYGYIYAGIQANSLYDPGSILLVVDADYWGPLANELAQLETDLIADGWNVLWISANKQDPVTSVKNSIVETYNFTPDLEAVYLIGHIPVPYSGDIFPDTHFDHKGAWPADVYYADMDGVWTDNTVSVDTAYFERNHNFPGDGKFDQGAIPSEVELQLGRVDFYDMPSFSEGEIELTRKYLNKVHCFKVADIKYERRGLIDDNFGQAFAAPAASGWRNFATMFGAENVFELDYFTTLRENNYLWSFGCGGGSHVSAAGIGTTTDFANDSLLTAFTMLFGSQFGDWDNPDNFLKAPLASGNTLTNVWSGSNPSWTFHHMALGHSIGYSALRNQNSGNGVYYNGPQLTHVALMGDPTLRMHNIQPPNAFTSTQEDATVNLAWEPSFDAGVFAYNIYRSSTIDGQFEKINSTFITDTSFEDTAPLDGNNVYMVRAIKEEVEGSGSYYNMSLGVIDSVEYSFSTSLSNAIEASVSIYPNPSSGKVFVNLNGLKEDRYTVKIMDKLGRTVSVQRAVNRNELSFDLSKLSNDIYFIHIENEGGEQFTKRLVLVK